MVAKPVILAFVRQRQEDGSKSGDSLFYISKFHISKGRIYRDAVSIII